VPIIATLSVSSDEARVPT